MTSRISRRRPPPYSRDLAATLATGNLSDWWGSSSDGHHATLWLLVGADAWRVAQSWRHARRLVTLLPPEQNPEDFTWRVLAGHDPILMMRCGATAGEVVERLLHAAMVDGVQRVIDINTGLRYVSSEEIAA